MILYTNGCSMTFGLELPEETREQTAWPAVLAERLSSKLVNDAQQGTANDRIFRRTVDFVMNYLAECGDPAHLFVAIGWTTAHRREFALAEYEGLADDIFYRTVRAAEGIREQPKFLRDIAKIYRDHIDCDTEASDRYHLQILSLQSILKSYGIPYLFTTCLVSPIPTTPIAQFIDHRRFMDFGKDRTFHSLCKFEWEAPLGPGCHPLEEGHRRWGEMISEYIRGNELWS
jgi:hypothetical protein